VTVRRLALLACAALTLAAPAAAQEGPPSEELRHAPEHVPADELFATLRSIAQIHGHGLGVALEEGAVVVRGLPEDIEALTQVVLLLDLPPVEPGEAPSAPEAIPWEGDTFRVISFDADEQCERWFRWLLHLQELDPHLHEAHVFWVEGVRRLVLFGADEEVDLLAQLGHTLQDAWDDGHSAGHRGE